MKPYSLFLLSAFFFFSSLQGFKDESFTTPTVDTSTHVPISISERSRCILNLLYITQRLEPAITHIKKSIIPSKKLKRKYIKKLVSFFSEASLVQSPQIQEMLCQIRNTHSLEPILGVWKQIKHFRYGIYPEEHVLILDFAKVCLVTYQILLTKPHKHSPVRGITPDELKDIKNIEDILQKIENCTLSYFLSPSVAKFIYDQPTDAFNTLTDELSASFAFRFYLNKRLERVFTTLKKLHENRVPVFTQGTAHLGFYEYKNGFTNEIIQCYFKSLQKTQSLEPLVQLIFQFQNFDFIRNVTFTKEFLLIICLVYKDLHLRATSSDIAFKERLFTHTKDFTTLSVEDLLFTIETVDDKLIKESLYSSNKKHAWHEKMYALTTGTLLTACIAYAGYKGLYEKHS